MMAFWLLQISGFSHGSLASGLQQTLLIVSEICPLTVV
jgi:hypothetical protein